MTTAKHWSVGTKLNLERALKIGDELGGHIVAGHADGIATIVTRDDLPDMARFELRTTRELARFIAAKGSVTLDGVSLTVNTVDDVAFSVLIIPHTLNVTTLGGWRAGSEVNLEVDLMARYAARLVGNEMTASAAKCVIRGLDPRIHPLNEMDCRIKSGNDERSWMVKRWQTRGAHS